jgi:diguanylate cyclase (GGDEF)-like protein
MDARALPRFRLLHGRLLGAVVSAPAPWRCCNRPGQFAERLVQGTCRVLESLERRAAITRRQTSGDLTDPLTGCASLDALDRRLTEEFERARRYGLSFSVVLLDIEGLAQVNERYGMEAGDRTLADLGAILQREIRGPDFVARYGGDEFALVLPETSLEGARRSIDRVRNRIAQHAFMGLLADDRPALRRCGHLSSIRPRCTPRTSSRWNRRWSASGGRGADWRGGGRDGIETSDTDD